MDPPLPTRGSRADSEEKAQNRATGAISQSKLKEQLLAAEKGALAGISRHPDLDLIAALNHYKLGSPRPV